MYGTFHYLITQPSLNVLALNRRADRSVTYISVVREHAAVFNRAKVLYGNLYELEIAWKESWQIQSNFNRCFSSFEIKLV